MDGIVGVIRLEQAGVMASDKLCTAAHLLAFKVKISTKYKEYYIDFELQGNEWVSIVLPEDEFKLFVKLLNEVISRV